MTFRTHERAVGLAKCRNRGMDDPKSRLYRYEIAQAYYDTCQRSEHAGGSAVLSDRLLAQNFITLGDWSRAIELCQEALAIGRALGDRAGVAVSQWTLGLALEQQGDLVNAMKRMQMCLDYEREIGDPHSEADAIYLEQLRQRLAAAPGAAPAEQDDEG